MEEARNEIDGSFLSSRVKSREALAG